MVFLFLIAALIALVWGAIAVRFLWKRSQGLSWFPVAGCLIVIVGSVLGREFFAINAGPIPLTLDRAILGGLLVTFVTLVLSGKLALQRPNLTDLSLIGITLVLTTSTFVHDFSIFEKTPLSRLLFFHWLPAAVYFLMRYSRVSPRELKLCGLLLVGFSIYLALTAVAEWKYQYWAVFPKYIVASETIEFLGRGRGPFLNPVSNGLYMILGFSILGMMFQQSRSPRAKTVCLILAGVIAAGVFATLTRSVWLSLALVGMILIGVTLGRTGKGVTILAAGVGLLLLFGVGNSLVEFKRDKNVSAHEMKQSAALRPLFAVVAFRMMQDRPLVGCGFGQYNVAKQPYLQDPTSKYPLHLTRPYMQHNIFLAYLTETGLVGVSLLLLLLTQLTRTGYRLWRDSRRHQSSRQLGLVLCLALLGFVVNGMFHDVSIAPQLLLQIYFLAGLSVAVAENRNNLVNTESGPETTEPFAEDPTVEALPERIAA